MVTRLVGRVQVVGRAKPVAVHELLGLRGESEPPRLDAQAVERFEKALADYVAGRFEEAAAGFAEVRDLCGGADGPSELYLDLIAGFRTEPPPADFDGVIRLTSK